MTHTTTTYQERHDRFESELRLLIRGERERCEVSGELLPCLMPPGGERAAARLAACGARAANQLMRDGHDVRPSLFETGRAHGPVTWFAAWCRFGEHR